MYELMLLFGSFGAMWAVLAWLACGLFAGHIAAEKDRWGFWWFCMGVLFGPLALISAVGLPDRNAAAHLPSPKTHVTCPDCAEFVRNEAKVCCHCGCKLTPAAGDRKMLGLHELLRGGTKKERDKSWVPAEYQDKL